MIATIGCDPPPLSKVTEDIVSKMGEVCEGEKERRGALFRTPHLDCTDFVPTGAGFSWVMVGLDGLCQKC